MKNDISNEDKMKTYKNVLALLRKTETAIKDLETYTKSIEGIVGKIDGIYDIINLKFKLTSAIYVVHRNMGTTLELMDNESKDN